MDSIKYLRTLMLHKYYVGVACWKMGLYLYAFTHDWTKFMPVELKGYIKKFGSKGINTGRDKSGYYDPTVDKDFSKSWNHHTHWNKHHWQYWAIPKDNLEGKPCFEVLDMPLKYIIEMLCDWCGASKAYKGKGMMFFWDNNRDKLRLSPYTYEFINANIEWISKKLKG